MEHSLNQVIEAVSEYLDYDFHFVDEFADELEEIVEDFDYYF